MEFSPSTSTPTTALPRLAEQLRVLSELTETLTYRLLELEERLASQELRVGPLLDVAAADPVGAALVQEEMELRLDDTEERLSRLEGVLNGLDSPVLAATSVAEAADAVASAEAADAAEDPGEDQGWEEEEPAAFAAEAAAGLDGVDSEGEGEEDDAYSPYRRIA